MRRDLILLGCCLGLLGALGCSDDESWQPPGTGGTGGTGGSSAGGGTGLTGGGTVVDTDCVIEGTTYYLDVTNGSDGNDGSTDQPWQTLAHAQATLQDGDGVLLRDGDYGAFEHDGTVHADWITFKADDDHSPVLTTISVDNTDSADAYLLITAWGPTSKLPGGARSSQCLQPWRPMV